MTPVNQEFLHDPDNGVQGDCLRAVLASILDKPIADVPHFAALHDTAEDFWMAVYDWCESVGYDYTMTEEAPPGALRYHVLGGPSPRSGFHAVVGLNGDVVFDPHPSRAGLKGSRASRHIHYLVPRS